MRRVATLLVCGLLLLAGAFDASGQSIQGGIRGAVRDANGVIPGAEVTLTNEATGVARTTVSNDVGEYNFSSVTPGTYAIKASLTGFKTFDRQGVRIGTTQFITLDLLLEVGQVSEEITVTGDAPLIETSNASTGEVLDRAALDALPAPGRNAFMISVSVPTVVATGDPQFNRQQDQTNASLLSLGGGTRRGNNYLVDGVAITDMRNRAMLIPSMEGIEEVKVQVHTYDAEMGRTGGGVFNVTLRSGSNAFHGSGFYQTRPVWGLSNNFFNDKAGVPKDESQYYRLWGGGAGGALIKNKTFYWGAIEGYRSYTTRNGALRFPTSRERRGDFSQTFNADGSLAVIYDPLNVVNGVRQPFPGNQIPGDRLSTVGQNIANLMPTPDQDTSINGQANYFRGASIIDRGDMFQGKLEHKLSDKLSLSGAYIDNTTQEPDTDYWKDTNPQGDPNRGKLFRDPKVLALNAVYIPNNTTAVTLHGGWSSFPDSCLPFDGRNPYDLASLGFPASYVNAVQFQKFPRGHVEGYGEFNNIDCTFGDRGRLDLVWRGWNINGSVSKFVGRHTFKYGADFRRQTIDVLCFGQSSGEFYFDRIYTVQDPNNVVSTQGNALASMLLGYVSPNASLESYVPILDEAARIRGLLRRLRSGRFPGQQPVHPELRPAVRIRAGLPREGRQHLGGVRPQCDHHAQQRNRAPRRSPLRGPRRLPRLPGRPVEDEVQPARGHGVLARRQDRPPRRVRHLLVAVELSVPRLADVRPVRIQHRDDGHSRIVRRAEPVGWRHRHPGRSVPREASTSPLARQMGS